MLADLVRMPPFIVSAAAAMVIFIVAVAAQALKIPGTAIMVEVLIWVYSAILAAVTSLSTRLSMRWRLPSLNEGRGVG